MEATIDARDLAAVSELMTPSPPPEPTIVPTQSLTPEPGRFKVTYVKAANVAYQEIERALKDSRYFEQLSDALSEALVLPEDISVLFGQCNQANAFYLKESRSIVFCYELWDVLVNKFLPFVTTAEELEEAFNGTITFIFFHEVGHALVDVLDLPITGREEDAVDQLSTLVLLGAGDEGRRAAINGAGFFLLSALSFSGSSDLAFRDEHSLGQQRFFNIMCWVYGENPTSQADLVPLMLPAERASKCPAEFERIKSSWDRLIAPYERLHK